METITPDRSVAEIPLGPELLEHLQRVHPSTSSDDELIERMIHTQKAINRLHALTIRDHAEFAYRRPDRPHRSATLPLLCQTSEFAVDEIAPALHLNPRTARIRFDLAITLHDQLPCLVDSLYAGHIDYTKAQTILEETAHLTPTEATAIALEVLKTAAHQTLAQVRALTRKLAHRIQPKNTVKAAKKKATSARDVKIFDLSDGNAELQAILESADAAVIKAAIDSAAWHAKKADRAAGKDIRSIGEARADALVDLMIQHLHTHYPTPTDTSTGTASSTTQDDTAASTPDPASTPAPESASAPSTNDQTDQTAPATAIKSIINVTIPLSEFLKLFHNTNDDNDCTTGSPGDIEGLGPVPGWVARSMTGDLLNNTTTRFRSVIFDDLTGQFLAATSPNYAPPTDLINHVRLRDRYCRFPGCRQPAKNCDLDHVDSWQTGGPTTETNLICLCRHHHRLKQSPAWRVRYRDGYVIWTARTGHIYISEPHDYRDPATLYGPPINIHEPPWNDETRWDEATSNHEARPTNETPRNAAMPHDEAVPTDETPCTEAMSNDELRWDDELTWDSESM